MKHFIPLTLSLILHNDSVLLGMKKRGFGEGFWNGFGGKIKKGETIKEAAIRECKEEAGIIVTQIEPRGTLRFSNEEDDKILHVYVFVVKAYLGTPQETEEMRPQFFPLDKIPYKNMWPDDRYWIPLLLGGKYFFGTFHFSDDKTIKSYELHECGKADVEKNMIQ